MDHFDPYGSDSGARRPGLRVGLALALIVGLNLIILGGIAGCLLVVVRELTTLGRPGLPTLLGVGGLLWLGRGIFFLLSRGPLPGRVAYPGDQPKLFSELQEVARRVGEKMPERVLLVPDAIIRLVEKGGLPAFRRRRDLIVGMVLLGRLSVGELRSLVAYELARAQGSEGRWMNLVCRVHAALSNALDASRRSLLLVPFELYARLFLVFTEPLCWQRRMMADFKVAALVGSALYARSLKHARHAAQQFASFLQREVITLLVAGALPDNVFEGFHVWLSRTGQAEPRETPPEEFPTNTVSGAFDRLTDERLSTIRSLPEGQPWDHPGPARGLLEQPERVERIITPFIVEMFRRRGIQQLDRKTMLVPWEEMEGRIIVPQQRARAEHVLKILGRMLSRKLESEEGIGIYLTLIGVPELRSRLVGRLEPNLERLPHALVPPVVQGILTRFLGTLVGNALVETRGYHWEKHIAEPLKVVGREGERLDPFSLAREVVEGKLNVGSFRMRLFEHGLFVGR